MTLPPIVPGRPEDEYGLPIAPPPPNQQQIAQGVTKGIWDFIFQWWAIMGAIALFFVVCCVGVIIIGQIGDH